MMIARRTLCIAAVVLSACGVVSAPAAGQQIMQEAKTAEGQLTPEQTQSVRDFAEAWMGRLVAGEPEDVTSARDAVLREFRTPGITDTFRDAFSVEVSRLMGDAVRSEDDLVRINAMIIATQLTNEGATQLIDTGLADDNAAVQYWSAKAYLQRVQRATAEDGPGMSNEAQRAVIGKIEQVYDSSPSVPVARVGFEILSNLDIPEARGTLLVLLNGRVAEHTDNPQASYLPEQTAIQLLSAEISRERRPDTDQVAQLARAAYRYFALINGQMQAGTILDEAKPGHMAMMDWCYKCLNAMSGKFPDLTVPSDTDAVNEMIRRGEWDELAGVARGWEDVLTAAPFGIAAEELE